MALGCIGRFVCAFVVGVPTFCHPFLPALKLIFEKKSYFCVVNHATGLCCLCLPYRDYMKAFLYYLSLPLLFVLNRLPFCILYLFSDILYYLIYHVVRYRRYIVRDNLVKSFPEKDLKEIKKIERKFYASLCDFFVEIIKLYGMSEKSIRKRKNQTENTAMPSE